MRAFRHLFVYQLKTRYKYLESFLKKVKINVVIEERPAVADLLEPTLLEKLEPRWSF